MNDDRQRPPPPPESFAAAKADARRLLRLARTGALATFDGANRAPLVTLVGVASDWDGAPLFLMSELARHTRNLADDARASLLVTSSGGRGDPLNQPRLTIGGPVVRHEDASSRERYVRRNPKAKLYAGFSDFAVRRMRIESVHFNGGFGRADILTPEDLATPLDDVEALGAAENELLTWLESLGDAPLARLAGEPDARRAWKPVGVDPDGLDLASGGRTARATFARAAVGPDEWRRRLQELLQSGG